MSAPLQPSLHLRSRSCHQSFLAEPHFPSHLVILIIHRVAPALGLVSSPRPPGPHRSTGTGLGKARPPFSGCRQPQGNGQGLQGRRGAPKVQRAEEPALPRLGPSLARCSPKEAGEEGLRVLHLALRFSQQRHSLSLLPGGVHDVAQLLGSGPTQPGDDSQAPDTAHSAEPRPLR